MDLNSLSGKDLDKYGESVGISRYQGLGLPEDDDSYRESIRHNVTIHCHTGKGAHNSKAGKQLFHMMHEQLYGVLVIDPNGEVIRIAAEYNSNGIAVYNSLYQAKKSAEKWTQNDNSGYTFVVQKVNLFEG